MGSLPLTSQNIQTAPEVLVYSSTNPAPGVTFTPTGDYSGFFTSTDPDRRFVFTCDDTDYPPGIMLSTVAPHLHPLTLAEAKEEAREHYEGVIRDARIEMAHNAALTPEQFS